MKILYLDGFSGISGDMMLGSLLDVGVPLERIETTFRRLPVSPVKVRVKKVDRQGIRATKVDFTFSDSGHVSRDYHEIRKIVEGASLGARVKKRSLAAFAALAKAESKVHGIEMERIHFHEVGGMDTLCDVVGTMAALDFLNVGEVYVSPLPYGRGTITCDHGILPNPAPATLELLKGFQTYPLPYDMEFVTPTGAAILQALIDPMRSVPPYRLVGVGIGGGDREIEGRPNVLRAFLGETEESVMADWVVVLETDIDDETPEVLAYVARALFKRGALDVTSHPVVMKKGRLGTRLSVVAPEGRGEDLAVFLLEETSTLGVRLLPVSRRLLPRRIETISTSLGEVRVKVADLEMGRRRVTPEYTSCARLARIHHRPLRQVMNLVQREVEAILKDGYLDKDK